MKTDKEIIAGFRRRINPDNYEKTAGDTLLKNEHFGMSGRLGLLEYPESKFELDEDRVEDFILNALSEQREEFIGNHDKVIEELKLAQEHCAALIDHLADKTLSLGCKEILKILTPKK